MKKRHRGDISPSHLLNIARDDSEQTELLTIDFNKEEGGGGDRDQLQNKLKERLEQDELLFIDTALATVRMGS